MTMKALLQTKQADGAKHPHGDIGTMKIGTVDAPTEPQAGHVIVRVYAAGLNPVDIKRTAAPIPPDSTPIVGHDFAGVVESVGADVTDVQEGDKVFGDMQANTVGPKPTGSCAEYLECRADLLVKMPDGLSFTEAAGLPLVSQTAIQVLNRAGLTIDGKVFVTAGAGGVGLHLMQIAKHLFGASEVATTASSKKVDIVTRYGADIVVDYHNEDAGEKLENWADVAVDCTDERDMILKIAKDKSNTISILPTDDERVQSWVVAPNHDDMLSVARLVEEGKLKCVIDSVYDLDDALKAFERQASSRSVGKIIIKIRDD